MLNSLKSLVDKDIFSLLTPKRQLVGLDIGSSGIKLVQLKENRGRYVLQKFGFKPLEPEVIVDGTVMMTLLMNESSMPCDPRTSV